MLDEPADEPEDFESEPDELDEEDDEALAEVLESDDLESEDFEADAGDGVLLDDEPRLSLR
ncbi:hypothetical protein GCM10010277_50230 [Streptomyces longisporoflavus]|nr:hypothetical protein GCM10010277_50230 [Streptomyces longisporoflavus]